MLVRVGGWVGGLGIRDVLQVYLRTVFVVHVLHRNMSK